MRDCFCIDKDKLCQLGYYSIPGSKGNKGESGAGIETKGKYKTLDEFLKEHPTGNEGDTYIAGGVLYCWDSKDNAWQNVGDISGDKGDIGIKGAVGDTGSVGEKGVKGDTGDAGEKGDTGDTGLDGAWGLKGATGDMGPTGDKGPLGDKGPTGDVGDIGIKGLSGIKGATGDVGMQITCESFIVSSTEQNTNIEANSIPYFYNTFHYGDHILHDVNSEFFTLKANHRYYIKVFVSGLAETINPIKGSLYLDNTKVASLESANSSGFCYAMAMTVVEPTMEQYLRVSLGPNFSNFNSTISIMSVS